MFDPAGPTLFELAQQALASTDAGYDMLAPKFDHTPFCTPAHVVQACVPYFQAEGASAPRRGLDLCCGTGAAARVLRRVCTEQVLGVDRSAGMLAQAERLSTEDDGCPVRFEQGDATKYVASPKVDLIVSFGAFGHILSHEQPPFLAAIYESLVPGGRFVFVTGPMPSLLNPGRWVAHAFNGVMHVRNALKKPPFHMYYLNFGTERATELCEKAGFVVVRHGRAVPLAPLSADQPSSWPDLRLDVLVATRP